jgi:uncharacterized phosphosugar-binding protein
MRTRHSGSVTPTTTPHMQQAPVRARMRLADTADEVVDTLVPPGDVSYPPAAPATAPLSSLTSVYLWNPAARTPGGSGRRSRHRAAARWDSANLEGGTDRNADMAGHYRSRIPSYDRAPFPHSRMVL